MKKYLGVDNLLMNRKRVARCSKGHKKKLQKGICLNDTNKYSFHQRSIDTWNGLKEEVIMAKNVELKTKQILIRRQDHTSVAQVLYITTVMGRRWSNDQSIEEENSMTRVRITLEIGHFSS